MSRELLDLLVQSSDSLHCLEAIPLSCLVEDRGSIPPSGNLPVSDLLQVIHSLMDFGYLPTLVGPLPLQGVHGGILSYALGVIHGQEDECSWVVNCG